MQLKIWEWDSDFGLIVWVEHSNSVRIGEDVIQLHESVIGADSVLAYACNWITLSRATKECAQ